MNNTKYILSTLLLLSSFAVNAIASEQFTIHQINKSFERNGDVVRSIEIKKGDTIHFKNKDTVIHNIVSFSKPKEFNTGPYGKGKKESVTFDKVGTIDVECAIHPRMMLKVVVEE